MKKADSKFEHGSGRCEYNVSYLERTDIDCSTTDAFSTCNCLEDINIRAVILFQIDTVNNVAKYLSCKEYDYLMNNVYSVLTKVLGEEVTIVKFGSNKYSLATDEYSKIEHLIWKINSIKEQPFNVSGNEIYLDFWFGSSSTKLRHDNEFSQLLDDAKVALYEARRRQHKHVHFSQSLRDDHDNRNKAYSKLKSAVTNCQFIPYFQPIIDLNSGLIVGVESLARWDDPDRGIVAPFEFIPLAEENGLIDLIGLSIFRKSLLWYQYNYDSIINVENFSIHINVSTRQLMNANFSYDVKAILDELNYGYRNICFEITESISMESKQAIDTLFKLHEIGIQFSLDDFGTGYSSFSYLRDIKFSSLKIDRSFVTSDNEELLRAMITMGRALGCKVIAEGVESQEQCDLLMELDCNMAQGFLFSRPLSSSDIMSFIKRNDSYVKISD
ncbi:putative bifunctional diguanylate cyclase/phosphodiesterase [Vibrio scophthalmi]|uniref:putative bifunctional diguanylate cyclase/phosphodiesterase n=1 Tax=Vibrio scophthalmi TaxID=45658 RepID=UPI003EB752F2